MCVPFAEVGLFDVGVEGFGFRAGQGVGRRGVLRVAQLLGQVRRRRRRRYRRRGRRRRRAVKVRARRLRR